MDLFDKFKISNQVRARMLAAGEDPVGVVMDEILSATCARVNGREVVLAGTNNYLGLTFDPAAIEAARDTLAQQGTGTTGSRIANGTYGGHKALETALARFTGYEHCMIFSTGYQANLGMIAGLCGPNDVVMIDADSHASIYDACKMSGATIMRFRHNSPENLDKRLSRLETTGNVLIVVEGLYSMIGDTAPLAEFVEVKKKYDAYLMVDEAHSFGVYGERGIGVTERDDVFEDVDFLVGTFSKSLGAIGGFAVSNHPQFDILRVSARAYMFTASLSPANVASTLKTLERIESDATLRTDLWRNARALHEGLEGLGLELTAGVGPIVSVRTPDVETTVAAWNALLEAGVYVNLSMPPATPNSVCLLRCSVSAAHSLAEIDRIVDAFAMVAKTFGLGREDVAKLAAAGE